jgi:hypothetical protein
MNTALSAHKILRLPLTQRKAAHNGRKRQAYHVYLSRFFYDLRSLSEEEKVEEITGPNGLEQSVLGSYYDVDSDADSVDSVVWAWQPDLMRLCGKRWHHWERQNKMVGRQGH